MLGIGIDAVDVELNLKGFVDFREDTRGGKIDVHNGADDLDDFTGVAHVRKDRGKGRRERVVKN